MNEKNLVICDKEFRYASSLGENISERNDLAVKVYVCSSFENVSELSQNKRIHLFIVDESFTFEERNQIEASQIFVLTRGKVADLGENEWAVYKYRCSDEIIREVFEFYIDKTKENIMKTIRKDRAKMIAIYSPIHRIGKTRFAIALGKECAKKKKVLYLNLEEYAGFEMEQENEQNLGDLLYYLKQGSENIGVRLKSVARELDELDVVSPIPIVQDLKEITWSEWEMLLTEVLENSTYELVILDVGESVQGLFQILEMCDHVYMPVLEDEISQRKLQQYERNLEQLKLDKLRRNTYQFVMPENVEEYAKIRMKEEC